MVEQYGPTLSLSKEIHETKYRTEGETFEDSCYRVSSTLSDNDTHRHQLSDILLNMRFLPAGRVQAAIGSPRKITPWNCLSGETKIVTKEYGLVELASISGQEVTVLDEEKNWIKVPIHNHGEQSTLNVELSNGRTTLNIRATYDHDWYTQRGIKKTNQLKINDRIPLNIPSANSQSDEYKKGIIHGLVYGDGDKDHKYNGYRLRVCSDLDDLKTYLEAYPYSKPPSYNGDRIYYFYGVNSFAEMKNFPTDISNTDYLYGFISGWFAADGCVSTQPEVTICGDEKEKEWLESYGPIIGVNVVGSSKLSLFTNFGRRKKESLNIRLSRATLTSEFFIIERKKKRFISKVNNEWRVKSVGQEDIVNVYCPSVHTTNSFLGEQGILLRNCFVSGAIADDFNDIMEKAKEAGHTMRLGGGIGYDFSSLRPRGSLIKSLGSQSSGPISFMDIFDSVCGTIASAGHRRGAQMGVLRVDHPDIEEFVHAKRNSNKLTRFNISVGITDPFMEAVKNGTDFNLKFKGRVVRQVSATALWDSIMRSTWDWAEPGVLFIDRINEYNNLHYCENLTTTNPLAIN